MTGIHPARFGLLSITVFLWWAPVSGTVGSEITDSLTAILLSSGFPYCQAKADSALSVRVRTVFATSAQLLEAGGYHLALEMLSIIRPPEKLARIYHAVLSAEACLGLKHFARADSFFQEALELTEKSVWTQYLQARRAQIHPSLNLNPSQRLEFLSAQLQVRHPDSLKIHLLLEQLRLKGFSGRPGRGDSLLISLFRLDNLDRRLDSIYALISENSMPGQRFPEAELALARFESKKGLYQPAIKRCIAIAKKAKRKKTLKAMRILHPGLRFKRGSYLKAINYYQKYLNLYGNHPEVLLQVARAKKKLGKMNEARDWYDKFTRIYPRHAKTEEIWWIRGWDAEMAGRYQRALSYYKRLLPRFQNRKRGRWARFRIGYVYFKQKQYNMAIKHFKIAEKHPDGRSSELAAAYWRGIALEKMGKRRESRQQLIRTYQNAPFHYYGHIARQRLEERNAWRESYRIPGLLGEHSSDSLQAWIKSLPGPRSNGPYESSFFTISDLLALRLNTLAELTFDAAYRLHRRDAWFLYTFALAFHNIWEEKCYRMALGLSRKVDFTRPAEVPMQLMRLIYPMPFSEIVSEYAQKESVDKYFIFALMKQESGFMHRVISSAGAIGLMQIMPATGRNLAEKLRLDGFIPSNLRVPYVNISLGTFYLRLLKEKYDGDLVLTLCNYNAGPVSTARWRKRLEGLPRDRFIEDISYWETRNYVKKVLGNYWNYILMYRK